MFFYYFTSFRFLPLQWHCWQTTCIKSSVAPERGGVLVKVIDRPRSSKIGKEFSSLSRACVGGAHDSKSLNFDALFFFVLV